MRQPAPKAGFPSSHAYQPERSVALLSYDTRQRVTPHAHPGTFSLPCLATNLPFAIPRRNVSDDVDVYSVNLTNHFVDMLLCLATPEASPVFFACWCMLAQGACLDSGVIVDRHRIVTAGLRNLAG
jgi:hypothetical protein